MRAHRDDDLADLMTLAGNWEISRWTGTIPHPYTETDGRDWIRFAMKARGYLFITGCHQALMDQGRRLDRRYSRRLISAPFPG
jgi:hypothetical protein